MSSDDFGFANSTRMSKIAAIKPAGTALENHAVETSAIDAAGEKHGFTSRSGEEKIINRRKNVGPTAALNVRCPVRVFNPFVQFCENERLSYWEGIERLMKLARVQE